MGELDYDAKRLVEDDAYREAVWARFVWWYGQSEEELWGGDPDTFGTAAKYQVIFATTALAQNIDAGRPTHFIRKAMKDAFNGRGVHGGNFVEVLKTIIQRIRTETYADAVVSSEK